MTSSTKFSAGNVSRQSRRIPGSAEKSAIRVPSVVGDTSSVFTGAKLIALGRSNSTWPEKAGVGTRRPSTMHGFFGPTSSKWLHAEGMTEVKSTVGKLAEGGVLRQ